MCVYIYIYPRPAHANGLGTEGMLAQDKGGSSKGGFLNNILCSYTDTYIYIYIYIHIMK